MASTIWKLCNTNLNCKLGGLNICGSIRYGHHLRGKPPGVARSLTQRLEELNYKDPKLHFRVDIGLPHGGLTRTKEYEKKIDLLKTNRKDETLEKKARNRELLICLDKVKEEWELTGAPYHIKKVADHYGVFQDLFGDAFFIPGVSLHVAYSNNDVKVPVYYGNVVKPAEATKLPEIKYKSDENSLWTLILTNPDGNLTEDNKEYVHWFIGNIPGNNIGEGETVINYLQPIPPKGTGYHRHIFVLYKQEGNIDFSDLKKDGSCLNLKDRTFSTLDFYKNKQDILTPAALAFFQSDWDLTLTDFYHNTLDMMEPIFEYDFPETYVKPQTWFPLREAFNLYMDRYRDPKQINKEFLIRKLKNVHPFKPTEPPLPYPNAHYFEGYVPSWLKLEKRKSRLGHGRINDIE